VPAFRTVKGTGATIVTWPMLAGPGPSILLTKIAQWDAVAVSLTSDPVLLNSEERVSLTRGVQYTPIQLLPPWIKLHTPTPVIPEIPSPVFGQPVGFPSVMDALTVTSGRLLSELAVCDDLGMEPEVRVDVEETLDNPNILIVGPVECISDLPDPQSVRSMASEQSLQTALLMLGYFCVTVKRLAPMRLPAPPRLLTLPLLPPSSEPAFSVLMMPIACPVWPLPPLGSAHQIL